MIRRSLVSIVALTALAWSVSALAQRCGPDGQCVCGICQIK